MNSESTTSIPQELFFELPRAVPAGFRTSFLRQPSYGSLPSAATPNNYIVQIQVPELPNTFLYPDSSYINVRAKITLTPSGTPDPAIADYAVLLGSGASIFNRLVISFNNTTVIEDISELGVFVNHMINLTVSGSQKQALGCGFGCSGLSGLDGQTSLGTVLGFGGETITANVATVNFAIPLPGILGSGAGGKMIPMFLGGYNVQLYTDDIANYVVSGTAKYAPASIELTSVEFCAEILQVDNASMSAIISSLPIPGKMYIKGNTCTTSTASLASAANGTQEILVSSRVASQKALLMSCSPSDAYEKKYASVFPNLGSQTALSINSVFYPQQGLSPCFAPADTFQQQRIALNAGNATTHLGCIRPNNFRVSSVATGLCRAYNTLAIASSATAGAISSVTGASDQALLLINTEHFMQRGILSGVDTRASSSFMRYNIVAALSAKVHTVYFFSLHDVILECDLVNRTISRKV